MATQPIWTTKRQLMGNLIPLLPMAPIGALAWIAKDKLDNAGLAVLIGALSISCWLLMNFFGLFQREGIRAELAARWPQATGGLYVGIATEKVRSALDPHADVGFLSIGQDELSFRGDALSEAFPRSEVLGIANRANAHSMVLLGGYVSVVGKSRRWDIELREAPTLWGNRARRNKLKADLEAWLTRK